MSIKAVKGYKWKLWEDVSVYLPSSSNVCPQEWGESKHGLVRVKHLTLYIKAGYAWNGANVVWDTKTIVRGSLVHDALYQLIRENSLDESYRNLADKIFREICLEDRMIRMRAWWIFKAVRKYGIHAVKGKPKIYTYGK